MVVARIEAGLAPAATPDHCALTVDAALGWEPAAGDGPSET